MSAADRVKITGKVQIDVFHWHHLRITASGGAAFHSETWAETGFAQAHHCIFLEPVQRVTERNSCGGFAFSSRCRSYCRNQDQFAVLLIAEGVDEIQINLGLGMAVGNQ